MTIVLSILSERPMHGYELIQTIRERSDGIFDFSDGTVYPMLYSLRDQELIESRTEISEEGRARKVYRLTAEGRSALVRKLEDWRLFVRGMELALGGAS